MMIAYPAFNGLPDWEPPREILEGNYDPSQSASDAFDVYFTSIQTIVFGSREDCLMVGWKRINCW